MTQSGVVVGIAVIWPAWNHHNGVSFFLSTQRIGKLKSHRQHSDQCQHATIIQYIFRYICILACASRMKTCPLLRVSVECTVFTHLHRLCHSSDSSRHSWCSHLVVRGETGGSLFSTTSPPQSTRRTSALSFTPSRTQSCRKTSKISCCSDLKATDDSSSDSKLWNQPWKQALRTWRQSALTLQPVVDPHILAELWTCGAV